MKFLLTSAGIQNLSIHSALADLFGKLIAESNALCILTGIYPFPGGPSFYGQGVGMPEVKGTLHWFETKGTSPAVEISVDKFRQP